MEDSGAGKADTGVKYLLIGLGLGALAGVAAGVLLAPKPGAETRVEMSDTVRKASERIKQLIDERFIAKPCEDEGKIEGRVMNAAEVPSGKRG